MRPSRLVTKSAPEEPWTWEQLSRELSSIEWPATTRQGILKVLSEPAAAPRSLPDRMDSVLLFVKNDLGSGLDSRCRKLLLE
ncbi:hypothetical protein CYMTET_35945, partial [Cymbomonas tetramitiformis]